MWANVSCLIETEDEIKLQEKGRKFLLFWNYFILSFWDVDLFQLLQNYIFAYDVAGL